jgi:stringent starvation protein B
MQDKRSFPINYFLIDAGINWINENNGIAQIVVDITYPDSIIPTHILSDAGGNECMFIELTPETISNFKFDKESMSFELDVYGEKEYFFFPIYSIKFVQQKDYEMHVSLPVLDKQEYIKNRDFYSPSLSKDNFYAKEKMRAIAGFNNSSRTPSTKKASHLTLVH